MSGFSQLLEYHVFNSRYSLADLTEAQQNEMLWAYGKSLPKGEKWDLLDTSCPMPDVTLDAIKDGEKGAKLLLMMWRDVVYANQKGAINAEFEKAYAGEDEITREDRRDRVRDMAAEIRIGADVGYE